MKEQLYLNNQLVDLPQKAITRKIQIGDVADISSRKASFSYTFSLPRTAKNTLIFDMLGVNHNTSRKPFEKITADYIVDSIPLISGGYAIIKQTDDDYKINIYDGAIGLIESLKGKKINELNFNDLNHYSGTDIYLDSYTNTEGYIYAVADYGLPVSTPILVERQAPCVFTHTMWSKIFDEAGINYTGNFFTTNNDYLTEVITPSNGYEITEDDVVFDSLGSRTTDTVARNEFSDSYISYTDQHTWVSGSFSGFTTGGDGTLTSTITENIKIDITSTYTNSDTNLKLYVKKNDSAQSIITLPEGSTSKVSSILIPVESGDTLTFETVAQSNYLDEGEDVYNINYSVVNGITISTQSGGTFVDFATILQDVSQMDFIKDVMRRYGLILHPIKDSSDYKFMQIETLLNATSSAEDWTYKLNEITSEKYDSGYAKSNLAQYDYTEDVVSTNFDGTLATDNVNAADERTLFKSIYEIPLIAGDVYFNTTYSIPIWEALSGGVVGLIETPIKCLRLNYDTQNISAKFFSGTTSNYFGEVPFLSLNNVSMQYYINNYYKGFGNLINDYKEIDVSANLNVIDIYNLDFFKLKYLKQTGRYYMLNNVINKPNSNSKVKLLEVSAFSTNTAPTMIGEYSFLMGYNSTRIITEANLTTGTSPAYFDPESDSPLKVKITGGFNNDILIKQSGNTITATTEILFSELDLTIKDVASGTTSATTFTFDIADAGSGNYSGLNTGKINVTVESFVNTAPTADAGSGFHVDVYESNPTDPYTSTLNASASSDAESNIVSYKWFIDSKPVGSGAYTSAASASPFGTLYIPNELASEGSYTIRVLVKDAFDLTDEDTITVTVTYHSFE